MTNELNDLRTRGVETWSQTQKVEMFDERAHHKKEDEKAMVETWGRTQEVGRSDEETRHKKEAEKATRGVEIWSQTQKVLKKEMSDEEVCHKKEAEKAKLEKLIMEGGIFYAYLVQKKIVKVVGDAEGSEESDRVAKTR